MFDLPYLTYYVISMVHLSSDRCTHNKKLISKAFYRFGYVYTLTLQETFKSSKLLKNINSLHMVSYILYLQLFNINKF